MKKNNLRTCWATLLILFACFPLLGQDITYQANQKPLADILEDISAQYEVYFSYAPELLAPIKTSIRASQQPIEDFLHDLLDPYELQAQRSKGPYFFIQKARRTVSIRILDAGTDEPLAYAIVRSLNSRRGAYANAEGLAILEYDLREDTLLSVQQMGYISQRIRLQTRLPEQITLRLTQDPLELEAVVIEYQNEAITLREGAQFNLNLQEMRVLPGLAEADVLLSVQSLPGVESKDETASGINVRGGGSDELMVYWDGIPVYNQAHFFGTITTFIPSTVRDISVYKNYIPTEYTGATSGLMEISLPDSIPLRPRAILNSNMTHADAMVHVPIKDKVAILLAGRLSFHDQFNSPTYSSHRDKLFTGTRQENVLDILAMEEEEEEIPILSNQTRLAYQDLNAKIVFTPTPKDHIRLSVMRNQDRFFFDARLVEDAFLTERTHDVSFLGENLTYQRQWNAKWKSRLSISRADYQLDNIDLTIDDEGEDRQETTLANSLFNTEIKVSAAYQAGKRSTFRLGYQYNAYQNSFRFEETSLGDPPLRDTLEAEEISQGIFAQYHYSWQDKIDFQPQFRLDRVPGLNETLFNPVMALHYKITPDLWLKASYGQYFQLIRSLQEGDLDVSNVSEGIWLLAEASPLPDEEEELPIMESRQATFGALYKNQGWLIDLDFYWKQTEDLTSINQFNRNVAIDFTYGSAEARGVELMVRKSFGQYQSWLTYTYSRVMNEFEDLQEQAFPSSFDRPHQFRWVHSLYLAPVEISLGWMLKSGTPYTEPVGLAFFPDPNDPDDPDEPDPGEGEYDIVYGPINSSRLPLYHRLDFSLWYKFRPRGGHYSGHLGFSIQNLYNRENVWQRFFFLLDTNDDGVPEVNEEERFFLGFTPNLSLRINF